MRTNLFPNPRNTTSDSQQSWGQWSYIGTAPTIANTTSKWLSPVQTAVQVSWANPTAANGCNVGMYANLVVGQTYTASAWCYVPTGSPAVGINAYFVAVGSQTTVYDQWQRVSVTFTATSASQYIAFVPKVAVSTAGTYVFVAQPLLEVGTTVGDYFDGGYLSCFWNADGTSVSTAQGPQRINHCTNPSFELGTTSWTSNAGPSGVAPTTIDTTVFKVGKQSLKKTWTTTATGVGYVFQSGGLAQGVKPGVTYTASAQVYPSVDTQLYIEIQCLSSTNAILGVLHGAHTVCPANAWTQLSSTGTLVAGSAAYRTVIYEVIPMQAGQSINYDAMLLEEASEVLPYFDYYSANSAQVGSTMSAMGGPGLSPYSCSMTQSMPNLNPNLPELQVTAWPTKTPYGATMPYPMGYGATPNVAPMILSDRAVQVTTTRGRQYELDTDQTGTLSLKLDDSDGAVSSMLKPFNNIQVQAFWQGVVYDLWTGFANVVPSQSATARNAWSNLTGVDGLDVLANRALRSIQQEAILADNPERFFPLSDAAGSWSALDITQNGLPGSGQTAPLVHAVEGSDGALGPGSAISTFGASTVAVNGASAWSLSNLSSQGKLVQEAQIQVCGPDNQNGYQLDLTKAWAAEITCAITTPSGQGAGLFDEGPLFTMRDMGGVENIYVVISGDQVTIPMTQTQGIVTVFIGSVGYFQSQEISVAQAKKGVHVAVTYDGAGNYALIVNGVTTNYVDTTDHQSVVSWIGVGCSYGKGMGESYSINPSTVITLQNFAIYGSQLGVPGSSVFQDHYQAFLAYPQETAQTRTQRVLKWAGVSAMNTWPDAGDTRLLAIMQDTTGNSALSVIQQACQSVLSRFLVDQTGMPLYQDKGHDLLNVTPVAVFGSDEANGEIPYTGMPTVAIDPQHIFNDVTVTLDSGASSRYADQDSMSQYFQRVLQVSSSLNSVGDATSLSSYLVGRYADPPQRVSTMTVDLAANPSVTTAVLGIQVGQYVKLNHRTQSGVLSLDLHVDQISYAINSNSWVVSFELTPLYRYWIAAAGRSLVQTTQAAGVPTTVISPMQDSAYNPVEATIPVGAKMTVSPNDSTNTETLTVASVTSDKPGLPGYTTATITWTTNTGKAHTAGDTICDALPSGITDPTTWDAYSMVDSTTIPQW